jgi:hypothetical protein
VLKQVNENGNNMWGMLTAETCQPILEFDFLGPDSWAALGKSDAEVATLPAGDKKDLRERQVGVAVGCHTGHELRTEGYNDWLSLASRISVCVCICIVTIERFVVTLGMEK